MTHPDFIQMKDDIDRANGVEMSPPVPAVPAFEQELDEYARQWLLDAEIRDMEEALAHIVRRYAQ